MRSPATLLRAGAAAMFLIATVPLLPLSGPAAVAATGANPSAAGKPVTASKTVDRVYVQGHKTTVVDKRTVHLTVSDTHGLRSLQQIKVSWSGAHVTDGVELDENSDLAQNEEYSFDLFECRGVDSTKVPVKDRVSPNTCWTQYGDERFDGGYSAEPAWQSDAYATAAQRADQVEAPKQEASACKTQLYGVANQRWVPFDAADGKIYYGGPDGCQGLPPEASPANLSNLSLPSNETFGVTAPSGDGDAEFDVFTDEDHASLGCSQTVACSLVAIPIEGISCDPAGSKLPASQRPSAADAATAKTNCETNGSFKPGQLLTNVETSGAPAVDGSLWWSASNWRNRISIPLSFAPADNICSVVTKQAPIDFYGSELMSQAVTQWSPHFCLNSKLFNPKLVETPEPEARRLLAAGSVQSAVSSFAESPPDSVPTVDAPIAVSGFGVAFQIDKANHQPVATLNLDARLLAKLLTESYPDQTFVKSGYPQTNDVSTLSNNPLNITMDPEFRALNPGIPQKILDAAATILILNVQSDVTTALTSWINADPAARAWLNGQPDPWGMRVNPNYQGIKLPVSAWPLLDSYEPTSEYKIGLNDCLALDPVPYLPLVANPQSSLYQIALDTDFSIAQSQTTCDLPSPIPGDDTGAKLVAAGREAPGYRFMLSVVSLPDAARFNLPLASLETASSVSPTHAFTSPAGQTFIAPSTASLKAAADTARPDAQTGTWPLDYSKLREKPDAGAYPGTMVIYASVPTKGLPVSVATDYSEFLQYAAGPGQKQGVAEGDLPAGYLPLTAADGLGSLAAYTNRAASAVESQGGTQPSLTKAASSTSTSGSSSKSSPATSSSTSAAAPPPSTTTAPPTTTPNQGVGAVVPPVVTPPTAAVTVAPPASAPVVAPSVAPEALERTADVRPGVGAMLMPLVFVVLVLAIAGLAGVQLARWKKS